MTREKSTKQKKEETVIIDTSAKELGADIKTADDLKKFLTALRDRMSDGACPIVFGLGSITHVLNLNNIDQLMNDENREIARNIWLRLKQSGLHIKAPPLLFDGAEADSLVAP